MAKSHPSLHKHNFAQVPKAEIPRSSFDRSHSRKMTFSAGRLYPIFWDIALPGDTMNLNATLFGRLATQVVPLMDNLYLDTFFFAVPIRLLWANFRKMLGERDQPNDSTAYSMPVIQDDTNGGAAFIPAPYSIYDYFGLPVGTVATPLTGGLPLVNSLPFRAYNMVWNEWFRPQDLVGKIVENTDDGPDDPDDYELQYRFKRHDYFTSAQPWTQKSATIRIPSEFDFGGVELPVLGIGKWDQTYAQTNLNLYESGGTRRVFAKSSEIDSGATTTNTYIEEDGTTGYPNVRVEVPQFLLGTINELRTAVQLQRLFERDARGGTRMIEVIKSHFGVTSPDARMQRPEFLGGGTSVINTHPIAQTSATVGGGTPQGTLTGIGTVTGSNHSFVKSFTEHCIVIGLVNVRCDQTYQYGMDRFFSARTRWDLYWPGLDGVGEQAILNKEIHCRGKSRVDGSAVPYDEKAFGYQERYGDYRYKNSTICGEFRSCHATSLDAYHMAQEYSDAATVTLGEDFLTEAPPITRLVNTTWTDQLLLDVYFKYHHARPMRTYSVPGQMDHF